MNVLLRLFALILLLGLLLGCTQATAQEPAAEGGRKLTVSANATVLADPDAAVITFAVSATGGKGKEAREAADKRASAIKDGIDGLGLKNVMVEVVPLPLSLLVSGDPGPDGTQTTQGAQARSLFSVTAREKNKQKLREMVVRLADVVVENGGVGATDEASPRFRLPARAAAFGAVAAQPLEKVPGPSVEWLCESSTEPRQKAVKKAVDEALASARAVAENAKLKVTEVAVQQTVSFPSFRSRLTEPGVSASGRVPIEVSVTVTCSY
jgi:uncharacterized protein YggE